jgi:hypothetical protein
VPGRREEPTFESAARQESKTRLLEDETLGRGEAGWEGEMLMDVPDAAGNLDGS